MAKTTKTVNPLHFEDLEPHRFEDLVRQLIYDFREWRSLEATGRQGSDEGFDVRGWESGTTVSAGDYDEEDEEEGEIRDTGEVKDRIWLIQCKREKYITPKKLGAYLNQIRIHGTEPLYGLIFVAACDFSKKARDSLREWCVEHDISEHYLWGRAELEDLLFQPKYDHLLFAYFGISLQIRKRSAKTRLRGLLSIKRQAVRRLGNIGREGYQPVLLRDPDVREYPDKSEIPNFDSHPKWQVCVFAGHYYAGLEFIIKERFAYIQDNGVTWDYEERISSSMYVDPWRPDEDKELQFKVRKFWSKLADANRGTLEVVGLIPYEEVLAIDEHGDEYFPDPHIYVRFDRGDGPFSGGVYGRVKTYGPGRKSHIVRLEDRIEYFPQTYPDIEDK